MFKQLNIFLISLVMAVILFPSCNDDETQKKETQLFRPSLFKASPSSNKVTFTWTPIGRANYELDICLSQNFDSGLISYSLKEGVHEQIVEDLLIGNTTYYARIRCVSVDGSLKNSDYNVIDFTTW